MEKVTYKRCPRCELNYIKQNEELCSVCLAEVSLEKDEEYDELELDLCPVCKVNYIKPDEVMCASCLKERSLEDGTLPEEDYRKDDDEWNSYINRDDEDEYVSEDEETGDMASITDLDDGDLELDDDELDTISGGLDLDDDEDEDDDDDEYVSSKNDDDDFVDIDDDDDDFDDDDDDDDNEEDDDF